MTIVQEELADLYKSLECRNSWKNLRIRDEHRDERTKFGNIGTVGNSVKSELMGCQEQNYPEALRR